MALCLQHENSIICKFRDMYIYSAVPSAFCTMQNAPHVLVCCMTIYCSNLTIIDTVKLHNPLPPLLCPNPSLTQPVTAYPSMHHTHHIAPQRTPRALCSSSLEPRRLFPLQCALGDQ